MKASLSALSLVLATVMPLVAHASELKPLEAGSFVLGTHTVSVYYMRSGDTYEVVTTIAPAADAPGAPIRFVGYLPPGQRQIISVGAFGTTMAPETLELVNEGDVLSATRVTGKERYGLGAAASAGTGRAPALMVWASIGRGRSPRGARPQIEVNVADVRSDVRVVREAAASRPCRG